MKQHLCEFEVFEEDGAFVALPLGLSGATEGATFEEAVAMAADWFSTELEDAVIHGNALPQPPLGQPLSHNGQRVVVSCLADKSAIETVSATQAAQMLNVSRGRITQMLASAKLEGFREGRNTRVTLASIRQRLAEHPAAGRPSIERAFDENPAAPDTDQLRSAARAMVGILATSAAPISANA